MPRECHMNHQHNHWNLADHPAELMCTLGDQELRSQMARLLFSAVLLGVCARICSSLNLETRESFVKMIWSPAVLAMRDSNNSKLELPEDIQPSYFGFDLIYDNSTQRLIISAPKVTDASDPTKQAREMKNGSVVSAQGTIEVVEVNFTTNETISMTAKYPLVKSGDSFGQVLGGRGSALLACSPAEVLDCSSIAFMPGFCYESSDLGKIWTISNVTDAECPKDGLDLIFLLDESISIKEPNFKIIKDWVANMTSAFSDEISAGKTKVGVAKYSGRPRKTIIELGNYSNFDHLTMLIKNMSYIPGYGTYTADAMEQIVFDFLASPRWNDTTVTKIAIVLTDGDATDKGSLEVAASNLSSRGILTFAVGVKKYVQSQIETIAGNVSRAFGVTEFGGLDDIVKSLQIDIQSVVLEGSSGLVTSHHKQTGFSMAEQVSIVKRHPFLMFVFVLDA